MDYYKILEVSENADISEIKKKYRKLAMKYHPDKNAGDEKAAKKFREITEAYEVLGNGKKRKEYDYKRKNDNNQKQDKNKSKNVKNKFSSNNFTFGKEFFKSTAEMKGMFENSFGLDKMTKNKAKAEKENMKSRFESFFDMKEKK
ncbi:DnaJ domain-containing protein [Leptotrichia sp. oral taxon 223]|uniref:DnaJ domain-containing protein n=1 Tax=Leptotrichia sp. oral taxon 223 TaxID=712363 RepID=UPI0015BDCFE1|nr:DnaJ domain-containing protein [Leptotrichia sp. oral taxon 223]NWO18652.1 DnaJ domain-containing protein [Leptotrichia sp. oral taxon 223]